MFCHDLFKLFDDRAAARPGRVLQLPSAIAGRDETVAVRGVETGELTQFAGMAPGTTQKIVLTALGGSVATGPEGLTAPVVVVNNFEELAALGESKVRGKIVLFNAKFDERLEAQGGGLEAYGKAVAYRGGGATAAGRLGAVAALNRSAGSGANRLPHTGGLRYAEGAPRIPGAAVTAEDADLIASARSA